MGKPRMILLGPRAPSPAMSAKREKWIGSKNCAPIGAFAGEGARGPSKSFE